MASSNLTHYAHTNTLHPSIFPSVTYLPEDRDSYAITKWVTTGYWPWMSESSIQIPSNTSARLAKTPIHEVAVPYQNSSVVKPERRASETSTYLAFLNLAPDTSISSQNVGEDAAIDTPEETTGSPTIPAPAFEEGEIEKESNPRLKRKRSVSSASADALDQELLKLAAGTSTSLENADGDTTVERIEATIESLVLSRPALGEGEFEEGHRTPDIKERPHASPSQTSTNLSQELLVFCEFESSASPEAGTSAVDVSAATMERVSFPRQLLSTLTFQSLLSTHAASPPQGVSFYFHFRETWSNFGTCMEEDPEVESYVPEVDGDEVERGRVDDVTRTIIDGLDGEGNERSHKEKVERARLGVGFWREGRSSEAGVSVLIWKEGVRMFILRQKEE